MSKRTAIIVFSCFALITIAGFTYIIITGSIEANVRIRHSKIMKTMDACAGIIMPNNSALEKNKQNKPTYLLTVMQDLLHRENAQSEYNFEDELQGMYLIQNKHWFVIYKEEATDHRFSERIIEKMNTGKLSEIKYDPTNGTWSEGIDLIYSHW